MRAEWGKGSEMAEMFADFWDLMTRYGIPEESEEYWHQLDLEGTELAKKYDSKFMAGLVVEFMTEMDRRHNGVNTRYITRRD